MHPKFLALVVVYGCNPADAETIRSLSEVRGHNITLLVWDNSPTSSSIDRVREKWAGPLHYVSTPENIGLSAIYNRTIANYLHRNDFLVILDQDSKLPNDYFQVLTESIQRNEGIGLHLPLVRSDGLLVSPVHYFFGWGHYWRNARPGVYPSRLKVAINSGMAISGRYLKGELFTGYDEELRFYGTDTQFMVDYARNHHHFVVLNSVIHHSLSFFSASREGKVDKFLEMKRAHLYIHGRSGFWELCLARVVLGIVSLIYVLRYRTMRCLSV